MDNYIWLIPILPLAGFLINGLGRNVLPKSVIGIIGCAVVLASFVMSVMAFVLLSAPASHPREVNLFNWFDLGAFKVSFSFLVDRLSVIMMLIITGVGFLIHLYSTGYMHNDKGFGKFFSYLNLFIFFMLLLVMGAN